MSAPQDKQKPLKQYAVWESDNHEDSYWLYYDSIEDAVSQQGDGCDVYVFEGKLVGKFKRKVEMVKMKRKAKKK